MLAMARPVDRAKEVSVIAADYTHTLALKENGGVLCWGNQYMGGLTVPSEAQSGVAAIAAGYGFVVALKENGTTLIWGSNIAGDIAVPAEAQTGVVAIAAGAEHALALTSEGRVVAWGWNFFGQTNVPAAAFSGVVAVAAGQSHSVALKSDGTVLIWGSNHDNQLQAGVVSGKVAAISAGGAASFLKLALPWPSFSEAADLAGLGGADANPNATPFGDGVSNLLKYAFNVGLAEPYTNAAPNGTPGGLPKAGLVESETGSHWRVEFVRRKDPRLTYTPMKSTSLAEESFVPMNGLLVAEDISGFPAWERVTIDEPVNPASTLRFFSRLRVE